MSTQPPAAPTITQLTEGVAEAMKVLAAAKHRRTAAACALEKEHALWHEAVAALQLAHERLDVAIRSTAGLTAQEVSLA